MMLATTDGARSLGLAPSKTLTQASCQFVNHCLGCVHRPANSENALACHADSGLSRPDASVPKLRSLIAIHEDVMDILYP